MVVVGILIALQVNNWNESRKLNEEEKLLLQNLSRDFKNARNELLVLNRIRNDIIIGAQTIYGLTLDDFDGIDSKYIDSLLVLTFRTPTFNNQSGALELLFNSGKINLIQNDSLKNVLIEWPGQVEDYIETEQYSVELFNSTYMEYLSKYVSIQSIINQTTISDTYHMSTDFVNSKLEYEEILDDPYFKNLLIRRIWFEKGAISESQKLVKYTDAILSIIGEIIEN